MQIQVADEAADDGGLLRVLLAEVRAAWLHDVEELQADGGDAAEVAGARRALGAGLADVDPGREAGGIQLVDGRREHHVDAFRVGDREIALLVARIHGEVALRGRTARD